MNKATCNLNYLSYNLLYMELDLISILKEILSATIRRRIPAIFEVSKLFLSEHIWFSKISICVCAHAHACLQIPKQIQMSVSTFTYCLVSKVPPFCWASEIKWICPMQIIRASLISCFLFQRKWNHQINLCQKKKKKKSIAFQYTALHYLASIIMN